MANVTVTVSEPNVTVSTANISNVSVAQSVSNITVSNVATVANGEVITSLLSVTDNGGDGSLTYASNTGVFTYTGPSAAEVRAHLSNTAPILYDATTGVISANVDAIFSNTLANNWFTSQTTDNLTEGSTNLYFNGKNTDQLAEGSTNLYFTNSRANTWFSTQTTTGLAEGTNLYYTTARANSAIVDYLDGADISLAGLTVTGNADINQFNTNVVITPVSASTNSNIVFNSTRGKVIHSGDFGISTNENSVDDIDQLFFDNSSNVTISLVNTGGPGAALPSAPGVFTVENIRGFTGGTRPDPNRTYEMFKVDIENNPYNDTAGAQYRTKVTGNVVFNREQNRLVQSFYTGAGATGYEPLWTGAFEGKWHLPKANVGNINVAQGHPTNDSNTSIYDMAIVTGTRNSSGGSGPFYDDSQGISYSATSYRFDAGNAVVSGKTASEVETRWQKIWVPKTPPMPYQKVLSNVWPVTSVNYEGTYTAHNSLYINNDGGIFLDNDPDNGTYDGNSGISYGGTPSANSNENLKLNRYISVTNPASNSGVSANIANLNLVADRLGSTYGGVGNATIVENKGIIATLVTDYDTPMFAVEKRSGTNGIRSNTVTRAFKVDAGGNVTINEAFTLPNADGSLNQVLVTDGNSTVTWQDQSGSNASVVQYISENALTVGGNLTVNGNITANGNLNYENVTDLYVTDQKITLNSNAATDATVEIIANRPVAGSNTIIRWNETDDKWQFTNDGSTFYNLATSTSDVAEGTNLYYTTDRANSAIDAYQGNINTAGTITATGDITTSGFFEGDLNGAVTTDVYNNTGGTLTKGQAVYLTGSNTGDTPHVALADADDATKMPALGIIRENISNASTGQVVTSGVMNFASHGFTAGADLFIGTTAGALSETAPTGATGLIQKIGKVISTTHIIVQGAFRTNATPNLDEGKIFLGSSSNTAISVTPDSNFTTTGNAFSLSNSLTDVNTIATETDADLTFKVGNVVIRDITKNSVEFNSSASQDTGYRFTQIAGLDGIANFGITQSSAANANVTTTQIGGLFVGKTGTGSGSGNFPSDGTITTTAGSPYVQITGLSTTDTDGNLINLGTGTPTAKSHTDLATHYANNMVLVGGFGHETGYSIGGFPIGTKTAALISSDSGGNANIQMSANATVSDTFNAGTSTLSFPYFGLYHTINAGGNNSASGKTLALTGYSPATFGFTRFAIQGAMTLQNVLDGQNGANNSSISNLIQSFSSTTILDDSSNPITPSEFTVNDYDPFYSNFNMVALSENVHNKNIDEADSNDKLLPKYDRFPGGIVISSSKKGSLSSRQLPNDNLNNFGMNIYHDGLSHWTNSYNDGGSVSTGLNFFQHSDNTFQTTASLITRGGPRIMLGQYNGNANEGAENWYTRDNMEIGKFSWYGQSGTTGTPGSTLTPTAFIQATADGDMTSSDAVSMRHFARGTDGGKNAFLIYHKSNTSIGTKDVISLGAAPAISSGNLVLDCSTLGEEWANVKSTGFYSAGVVEATGNVIGGNVTTTGTVQGDTTVLKAFNETTVALGNQSGDISSSLNATNGSIYTVTATGGITINSIANAVAGTSMTIIITQDGTGSHALTSSMKFAGGDKTLSTAGGSIDVIAVFYDGTNYYASLTKAYA